MRKKILAMLLAAALAVSLLPGTAWASRGENDIAYPVTGGNIYFNAATGTITDCDYSVTAAIIPSEINGVLVTSIGDSAFFGHYSLASVTIPDSVTSIGNGAFGQCDSLTSVTIPNGVTSIGSGTFWMCFSLTSVTIPDSVTSIGRNAFLECGVTDVYYGGSESQWKQISIDNDHDYGSNDDLLNANIHYASAPTEPETPTFSDVTPGIWYEEAVQYVSERGLMGSTGGGKFSPDLTTTRGMIATILARLNGEDTNGGSTWYEKGMAWAKANGVSDGTNPTGDISREELAVMLYRDAGSPSVDASVLSTYPDNSSVDSWAVNGMAWAVANGIVTGSGGKLNPTGTATRAEAAAMLMRYCEKFGK